MKVLKTFLITLAIIIAAGAIFIMGRGIYIKAANKKTAATKITTSESATAGSTKKKARAKANPITKAIVSEALDTLAEQEGGMAKELMDSMSEEDKDTVTEIIASNVTLDTISELQDYASEDDPDALLKYAKDNFSEEDLSELQEILGKYNGTP